jgi:MFS family permease
MLAERAASSPRRTPRIRLDLIISGSICPDVAIRNQRDAGVQSAFDRTVRRMSAHGWREVAVVRAAAVVQGLALVTVPTLSTVLTDRAHFGLSQAAYGVLFLPQSVIAIVSCLAGGQLTRTFGVKRMLLCGFGAGALSMGLIVASASMTHDRSLVYGVLLSATACLGFGFAIVTPALNLLSGVYAPHSVDRAVLVVNALLGAAAVLSPLLLIAFVGLGIWWALPLLTCAAMLVLFGTCMRLPLQGPRKAAAGRSIQLPARFWIFAAFAFVYGLCEQMNGSWAPMYLTRHFGATASFGLLALALFWAFAAAGRVMFALLSKQLSETIVFRALPFVLAAAFVLLAVAPVGHGPALGAVAFALAGVGVSALLPLVISFCERSIPQEATSVTSYVFAMYLIGYGFAAFGAGPLQNSGFHLRSLYGASTLLALMGAALAFAIVGVLDGGTRSGTIVGART